MHAVRARLHVAGGCTTRWLRPQLRWLADALPALRHDGHHLRTSSARPPNARRAPPVRWPPHASLNAWLAKQPVAEWASQFERAGVLVRPLTAAAAAGAAVAAIATP